MKMYGVCVKGETELLGVYALESNSDFSVSVMYELSSRFYDEAIWLLETREDVETALTSDTQDYNSTYLRPTLGKYSPAELEIVEVEMSIKVV